jgi:hypothetical protein
MLWVAIKPLVASGKWDLKANVELLKKKEPSVNIQSGLYLKEPNIVKICYTPNFLKNANN